MSALSGVKLDLVQSVDDAARLLTWLGERRPGDFIGLDLETGQLPGRPTKDALSPWHGRIRLAQLGDGEHGWAIPWDEWSGVFYEAVNKYQGRFIIHNSAFDLRWLAVNSRWDIPWGRMEDSMIAAQVINPLESAALKTLTSKYIDTRAAAMQKLLDEKMLKGGWDWGTVPINLKEYWAYAALDTVITCHLWDLQQKQVGDSGPYRMAYELEMAVRQVCTRMELNGARVDLEYSQKKYDELRAYADSVKQWGKDTYGASLTAPRALINIFENRLGEEITELTPSGQKKMDKAQLQWFSINGLPESKNLADTVLKLRKAEKLAETYMANFLNQHVNGFVHPNIRTMGARTGRMSITDPALQTLNKGERTVRDAFIPSDPDNEVIMSCDLDQVEFRIFASMSEDPQLIELFRQADADALTGDVNADAFTYIMRDLYADPSAVKKDTRRKLVKGYIYGRLYGAGIAKQALTARVPESTMKTIADAFDRNYPGAKIFTQKIEDQGMRRLRTEGEAYVTTSTGRRLPCDDDRVYTLVNYLIQSTAAEVFKLDILKCDQAGLGDYLTVPVHDELVLSVPKSDAKDVGRTLQECMTTREGWRVPLLAGAPSVGSRWGDLID